MSEENQCTSEHRPEGSGLTLRCELWPRHGGKHKCEDMAADGGDIEWGELVKETKKDPKFGNLPGPGPGRPKGLLNRSTIFKNAVFDGIALAAKRLAEDKKTGDGSQAEYIADMLADNNHRGRIITIGSNMVPKELHAEVRIDHVSITMGPDDDCKED